MRKLLLVLLACAGLGAVLPGRAAAADSCGRPLAGTTAWIDTAPPALTDVFGRQGTILAASSGDFPAQLRTLGAVTVHFDMNLAARMGTPSAPTDPSTIVDRANRLFDYAAQQSGCPTPWVAENELSGAGLETPWSSTNAVYRQNVLTYLQTLAARGARPFLLVSSTPYTAGDAAAWWQQVASVADIVRETYFSAKKLHALGPVVGNRTLREGLRAGVGRFLAIGIPPSRLGVMLGFMSDRSHLGRDNLEPTQAWLDVVKWQALAARQVSQELKLATVWSWGWTTYNGTDDPDYAHAACVWLWTRSASLCNGPGAAGLGWDSSLTEGQLVLPPRTQCTIGTTRVTDDEIGGLTRLTGDPEIAYSSAFARAVETQATTVKQADILGAERAVVAEHFGGDATAYRAALAGAHVSLATARGILGDELRRDRIEQTIRVAQPTAAEVAQFYSSYGDMLARPVEVSPAPRWLGGKPSGYALEPVAPKRVFALPARATRTLQTFDGAYRVHALDAPVQLGTLPLAVVAPAIRAALEEFEQGHGYEQWTTGAQTRALRNTVCRGDDLPTPAPVELESFVPFLAGVA